VTKAFSAAVLAMALLPAQSQPPRFKARADLVQVDVVVVDRDGAPVRGLRATDFVLRDRGRAQSIASFDEVSRAVAAPANAAAVPADVKKDVADNQSVQADRLVVMVLDDLHIYRERTDRAKEIARQVVKDLGPAASMAVLFTSGDHSTQVTGDLSVLSAAVETLKGRQPWRRPHPAIDDQTGPRIDPEMGVDKLLTVLQRKQDASVQDFSDNLTQYKLLRDAARMLGSGDARRKAFVLVSEGIGKDLSGLFAARSRAGDVPQGGTEYAAGNAAALATVPPAGYHDDALIDMMESLRRSNVATYAIDPRGRVDSKDLARECFPAPHPGNDPCSEGMTDWVSPVRQAQHGLEIMSEASGGFAVTNTDDFTAGLARIVGDLDHYYLLGFYPADPKGKGYRPLDVKVADRPELRVRFRRGYMPGGSPPPPKNTSELVALSAGVLPKTDLPLRLAAITMPGGRGTATANVVLIVQVDARRAALEEKDGRLRDTLKYELLVVDEKKARVRSLAGLEAALTLSGNAAAGPAPDVAVYQVTDAVELPPGRYEFRVSAVSAKLGAGGSVYLAVDVPDFRAVPALGGLAIGYADGARVPVAPRHVAPAQRGARPAAADGRRPLPFAPSLDRAFTANDTLHVYVEGMASGARPAVLVDVVDASGKVVRSPSPSFSTGDVVRIESTIPLAGLQPGTYRLRATLSDTGRAPAVRDSAFVIR
jgi:VWFA-related protein